MNRETLPCYDVGYALLPEHYGNGYAREGCERVIQFVEDLGQTEVCAIVQENNPRSIHLLEKLGFNNKGILSMDDEDLVLFKRLL